MRAMTSRASAESAYGVFSVGLAAANLDSSSPLHPEKDPGDPREVPLPGCGILRRACGWACEAEGEGEGEGEGVKGSLVGWSFAASPQSTTAVAGGDNSQGQPIFC